MVYCPGQSLIWNLAGFWRVTQMRNNRDRQLSHLHTQWSQLFSMVFCEVYEDNLVVKIPHWDICWDSVRQWAIFVISHLRISPESKWDFNLGSIGLEQFFSDRFFSWQVFFSVLEPLVGLCLYCCALYKYWTTRNPYVNFEIFSSCVRFSFMKLSGQKPMVRFLWLNNRSL